MCLNLRWRPWLTRSRQCTAVRRGPEREKMEKAAVCYNRRHAVDVVSSQGTGTKPMIDARCACGARYAVAEADVGRRSLLGRTCFEEVRCVSAEPLPDGAGAGDFDTRLVFTAAPEGTRVGEQVLLGGCC